MWPSTLASISVSVAPIITPQRADDRDRPPHHRAALCGPARAARRQKSTPSCKGHSFSAKSLRYDGTEHDARRPARRQPPLRAGQRARADARTYNTSRGADAAADHDGPPRRQGGRDPGARRGLRRRGVRRARPHRGRGLARVPRRASGAFVAEPPARARSEALRDAAARLACVDAAPRPAARAARPPPPVVLPRPPDRRATLVSKRRYRPKAAKKTYANQLPTHTKGQASQLVKQVRRHQRRNTPPDAGSYFRRRRRRVFDWINNVAKWTSDGPEEREDGSQRVLRHYRRSHLSLRRARTS